MSTFLLISLYLCGLPYVLLMVLVVVGMFREGHTDRSELLPTVSVILPAHNEEDKLPATLASLAKQEYAGQVEFVIIDDRSTDRTREIIDSFAAEDSRFKLVRVTDPSRKLAPKVNAVQHGITQSAGEIILATDADCEYHPEWVAGMVAHFSEGVTMVVGYVSTSRPGEARSLLRRFESADWFTLMLVSRSLTRFGHKFASSANNLAYRRSAFEEAGGFGAAGRAPSGDEDLLTQRVGGLPGAKVVFAEEERTRVVTQGAENLRQLLRQRRRWVSRYHHVIHYQPAFMAGIVALGLTSVLLTLSVLTLPLWPKALPWVAGFWLIKALVEWVGFEVGTRQFGRRDLAGFTTLWWIVWHPAFIGFVSVASFFKPAAWHAGAESYRRLFFQRRLREFLRRFKDEELRG